MAAGTETTEIAKRPTGIMKNIEAVYINAHQRYFPASTPQNLARQMGSLLVIGTRKKNIIPNTLKRVWLIETCRAGRKPEPALAKAAITPFLALKSIFITRNYGPHSMFVYCQVMINVK